MVKTGMTTAMILNNKKKTHTNKKEIYAWSISSTKENYRQLQI